MTELFWFLITAMVVITLHEAGHLWAAMACGIPVKRFSIGFGQPIFMRRISIKSQPQPLELALAPIPLGGYVSFESAVGGESQSFDAMPIRARLITVLAGPLANVLLALLIWMALGLAGQTVLVPKLAQPLPGSVADRSGLTSGDVVRSVARPEEPPIAIHGLEHALDEWASALALRVPVVVEVERDGRLLTLTLDLAQETWNGQGSPLQALGFAGVWTPPVISKVLALGPADRAGVREGDVVQRINGLPTPDAVTLRRVIQRSGATAPLDEQVWEVDRQGQPVSLRVKPDRVEVNGVFQSRVQVMVGAEPLRQQVQLGFVDALGQSVERLAKGSKDMGQALWGLVGSPSPSQAQGQAQLVGPVGLAQMARQSADLGLEAWLLFVASLSLSLAWLNLLPIPVLDGGQAILLGLEAVWGKKLIERIRPQLSRVGVLLLLGLMAWAIYNDATRWMSGAVLPR